MGLFENSAEEPRMRINRYLITGVVLILLIGLGIWYQFRFYSEKKAVERFLNVLVTGDTRAAYEIWVPSAAGEGRGKSSYTYEDFVSDWGPNGFYGPVKSYAIETAQRPKDGSGVIVVISLSPFEKFPEDKDAEKQRYTKPARIWVESSDKSLSFPP